MASYSKLTLEKIEFFGSRGKALFKFVHQTADAFEAVVYFDIPQDATNVVELAYASFRDVTHSLHLAAGGKPAD